MTTKINNLEINYEIFGQGERLVLLHGWGADLHSFDSVAPLLSANFQVILADLPGFGRSSKITKTWGVLDYAYLVEKFLDHLDLKEIFLLGHSFGGSVAIYLASFSRRVKKLVLADSSGVRQKSLWLRLRIIIYKIFKFGVPLPYQESLRKLLGSIDYKSAGPLRQTFIKVVNEDLRYLLPKISIPSLLIWGEKDEVTPLKEAELIKAGIAGSQLHVFKEGGHFPQLERPEEFSQVVSQFLAKQN